MVLKRVSVDTSWEDAQLDSGCSQNTGIYWIGCRAHAYWNNGSSKGCDRLVHGSDFNPMVDQVNTLVGEVKYLKSAISNLTKHLNMGKPFELSEYLARYDKQQTTTHKKDLLTMSQAMQDVREMTQNATLYKQEHEHGKAVQILLEDLKKDVEGLKNEEVYTMIWTTDVKLPRMIAQIDCERNLSFIAEVPNHARRAGKMAETPSKDADKVNVIWDGGVAGSIAFQDWSKSRVRSEEGRPEICSILGHVVREDDEGAIPGAVGLSLGLREFTGQARKGIAVPWPAPNAEGKIQVLRGGGISSQGLRFFEDRLNVPEGAGEWHSWYRVAMPLATTRKLEVSQDFIQRTHENHPDWALVRFYITIDPTKKVLHANFVKRGKFGSGEEEIIFSAYAPLQVVAIRKSDTPKNPATPHEIELFAGADGKKYPNMLPTATFH